MASLTSSTVMGISSPAVVSRRARYSSLMDCWKSESYVLWEEGTPSCSKYPVTYPLADIVSQLLTFVKCDDSA